MKKYLLRLLVLITAGGVFGCVGPAYEYGPYGPGYGYYPDIAPYYSYGYPYPAYGSSFNFTYIHRDRDLSHPPAVHRHRGGIHHRPLMEYRHYDRGLGNHVSRHSVGNRNWNGNHIRQERTPTFHRHQAPRKYGVATLCNGGTSNAMALP